jgi:RNA-directed DNA polymerase
VQGDGYAMNGKAENQLATVPSGAKQAKETKTRWSWVESAVWSERMLTALEQGVKGGTWFSLTDKVYSKKNLYSAFARVKANKGASGVDHVTVEMYEKNLEKNIELLHCHLRDGTYHPQAIRRKYIPKPGKRGEKRPLGIPTIRDRVVQTALRSVLEPIFENEFAPNSYGFRPNRGCKDALREVQDLLNKGFVYVVDADLQSYFDTIPHERLMELIKRHIADNRVLSLIEQYLKQEILDGMERWTPEQGSPQGAVISPLLSNIYLNELDHYMMDEGFRMVRYADDLVILCKTEQYAQDAMKYLSSWVCNAGLKLHPTKTCIVNAIKDGFNFLGYCFVNNTRKVSEKSLKKLKDTIRMKTKRSRGDSIETIVKDVNKTLYGWFEYFKHSHRYTFTPIDRWIRIRLRSVLRKQNKLRHGGWCGRNNYRWPNSYFAKLGLLFLMDARAAACQSAKR